MAKPSFPGRPPSVPSVNPTRGQKQSRHRARPSLLLAAIALLSSLASAAGIDVHVRNSNGTLVGGADVLLYDAAWTLLTSKVTDVNGHVQFGLLSYGTFHVEVYYSGAGPREFWGSDANISLQQPLIARQFTRNWPYQSSATIPGGNVSAGQPLTIKIVTRNDLQLSRSVYVELWVDRDLSSGWDYHKFSAPQVVPGLGATKEFAFKDVLPPASGTYSWKAHIHSYNNGAGRHIITDASNWAIAFTASKPSSVASWTQKFPATVPTAAYSHAMAYDRVRHRVVLFGGTIYGRSSETWEWDGNNWNRRAPTTRPAARTSHAMAYDDARQRVILFGGDGNGLLADTWEWDGNDWSLRSPSTSPRPRFQHAMVYDSARQRVVLFGGQWNSVLLSDTWEWDGNDWTQRNPTSSPIGRERHAMAYDAARKRTVLFSGSTPFGSGVWNDTWEWDGNDWTQRNPATVPRIFSSHTMTYDDVRACVVLFGAAGLGGVQTPQTWEWHQNNWVQCNPTNRPSGHWDPAMVYDSYRQRTVLFGGTCFSCGILSETWEYGSSTSTTSTITGTVTIAGHAASNIPITFTSPSGNAGPFRSGSSGNYSITIDHARIPKGTTGAVTADLLGQTFYYTRSPVSANSVQSDLNVPASTNSGLNISIPRPLVLVHGIASGPSRWKATQSELGMSLKSRLSSPTHQPAQARIMWPVDYGTWWRQKTINQDAANIHGDIQGFRTALANKHGSTVLGVPIDILAHSKGGLVARAYINNHVTSGDVRHLITLGTPHGGWFPIVHVPRGLLIPDLFDMHPYEAWGFDPLSGRAILGSYGNTIRNLRGATFDVIGSDQPGSLILGAPLVHMVGLAIQGRLPSGWAGSFYDYWPYGDSVVSSWSSVVYPVLHSPATISVRHWAVVGDLHFAAGPSTIPSHSTLEKYVVPWLR